MSLYNPQTIVVLTPEGSEPVSFTLRGIHKGEDLHQSLDRLLDEHSFAQKTAIQVVWLNRDGSCLTEAITAYRGEKAATAFGDLQAP